MDREAATETVTLADGATLTVRDLTAEDRVAYIEGLGAMSDRSRYLRFAGPKPQLSEREIDYLTHADGDKHVALVAIDGPHGVGVARYVRFAPGRAEVAIGLADAWQGRGLGRVLMEMLIGRARTAGDIAVLEGMVLADNRAAGTLLRRCGFGLDRREGPLLVLALAL